MVKTIAVLGASTDRSKFGNKCVRAYVRKGWKVFPVSLKGGEIEGLQSYAKLADIPDELDRISVYLHPAVGIGQLEQIAAKGAGEVWFNPGAADSLLLDKAGSMGINAVPGCSIVDIGLSPSLFP
jgi:predicted CoA-binding protein